MKYKLSHIMRIAKELDALPALDAAARRRDRVDRTIETVVRKAMAVPRTDVSPPSAGGMFGRRNNKPRVVKGRQRAPKGGLSN